MNSNRVIVRNTMILYVRMFMLMALGLYTARIFYNALGETDFGLYNIVGSIVTAFSFLSIALTSASQRYITVSLGKDEKKRKEIFTSLMYVHTILALILFGICESIGLWIVSSKLSIPVDRYMVAMIVYQISILTFVVPIVFIPFTGLLIASEKMGVFSYISILEALLKLFAAWIILHIDWDKLLLYSIISLIASLVVPFIVAAYCLKMFPFCSISIMYNKNIVREITSFCKWTTLNGISHIAKNQGLNIVLNIFWSVSINAAMGIANQVSMNLFKFVANFQQAYRPRLTLNFVDGKYAEAFKMADQTSKFSFFLLLIIYVPLLFNIDYILNLWLGSYPQYTVFFILCICVEQLFDCIGAPYDVLLYADGRIKYVQIVRFFVMLLIVPLTYFLAYYFCNLYIAFSYYILAAVFALLVRLFFCKKMLGYSFDDFISNVLSRIIIVSIISWLACYFINDKLIVSGWFSLLYTIFIYLLVVSAIILLFGMRRSEILFMLKMFRYDSN